MASRRRGSQVSIGGSTCCCNPNRNKVAPLNEGNTDIEIVEIRPKRHLRIFHGNPTPPDLDIGYGNGDPQRSFIRHSSGKVTLLPEPNNVDAKLPGQLLDGSGDRAMNGSVSGNKKLKKGSAESGNTPLLMSMASASSVALSLSSANTTKNINSAQTAKSETQNKQNVQSSSEPSSTTCNNGNLTSRVQDRNTALFFIHGVGGSSDVWRAQLDYFIDEGYEVIAPDFVGHGFSPAPKASLAYDFSEISKDMLAVFDRYCKRRNVIIGHSYGSCFAVVLARKRPRRVHKLVLISGGSPTPLAPQPGVFSLPSCCLMCFRPVLNRGFRKSAFHGERKIYKNPNLGFDVPTYVLKYTMNGQKWLEGDADYHRGVNVASLLIHGRQDQLVSLQEEQDMAEALYGSQLEIIDSASHMVMMEKPVEVNKLIHDFLLKNFRLLGSAKRRAEAAQAAAQKQSSLNNNELEYPENLSRECTDTLENEIQELAITQSANPEQEHAIPQREFEDQTEQPSPGRLKSQTEQPSPQRKINNQVEQPPPPGGLKDQTEKPMSPRGYKSQTEQPMSPETLNATPAAGDVRSSLTSLSSGKHLTGSELMIDHIRQRLEQPFSPGNHKKQGGDDVRGSVTSLKSVKSIPNSDILMHLR